MNAESIKLGLMPPLTGLVSIYGTEILCAAQIACAEVNEQGGVLGRPLELVVEDDGSLPESAVAAAERLVRQHGCAALIGNLLSNSRIAVAYRVAEPNRVPLLNFSFYEGSIQSRYFFHFAALPNQQIDRMIPFMREQFGPRFFFAGNNYEWPRGSIAFAKEALAKCGGVSLGEEYTDIGVTVEEIDRLLDIVAAAAPDVFVPYFAGADQINLLTRFAERGLKSNIAVVMGHYDEMLASKLSPQVREGLYSSNSYFMSVDSDANRDVLERLAQMPGVDGVWPHGNGILTNFGEGTYVCVKAFATAANAAGTTDPEGLVDALKTVRVTAPQGRVVMDPVTQHASVNSYLTRCNSEGVFDIIQAFELQPPVIPERYRHQKISSHATLEDDIRLQARMLEQMQGGVLLIDSGGQTVIYANAGAEKMFGYERGGLVNIPWQHLGQPDRDSGPSGLEDVVASILRHGAWEGELRQRHQDGTELHCMASFSTFTHPVQGEVWLAVYTDITERKAVEQALRERTAALRGTTELLENVLAAASEFSIIATDTGGVIKLFNKGAENLLGYAAADVVDQQTPAPFHLAQEVLARSAELSAEFGRPVEGFRVFVEVAEREGAEAREWTYVHKSGRHVPVSLVVSAMRDAHGRLTGYLGIAEDITERKAAESELRESEQRFRDAAQQLAMATEVAQLGVWDLDLVNGRLDWDAGMFRIYGVEEQDFRHVVEDWSRALLPEHLERATADFTQGVSHPGIPYESEFSILRPDGQIRHVRAMAQSIADRQGRAERVIGINEDITERKRVERLKSEFVSTVSHELRTPLTAIAGSLGLARSGALGAVPPAMVELLDVATRNSQRLTFLINDLLDIEKMASGQLQLDMREHDLLAIAQQAVDGAASLGVGRGVRLVCPAPSGEPLRVKVDEPRLVQVLSNLLSNAVKFSPDGGVVAVELAHHDGHARVSVSDQGPGVPEAFRDRIFGKFAQADASDTRQRGGTGLGLAISKELVERMHGHIGFESVEGQGARFFVDLPLAGQDQVKHSSTGDVQ